MELTASVVPVVPGEFVLPAGAQLRNCPDEALETALAGVWAETGECFGYPKPDGWRFQIHKRGDEIRLFSRSGKDRVAEFPRVAELIRSQVKCNEAILDTEVVGFDQQDHHLPPSELQNAAVQRCYLLDVLHLNGNDLTGEITRKRVALLWEILHKDCEGELIFSDYTFLRSLEDLVSFYNKCREMMSRGFDGAIIKRLDTPYFTDVLKLKPMETIDAVVLGAYYNAEERVNRLLLALPSGNTWKPVAKIAGSGSNWEAILSACQPYMTSQRPNDLDYVYPKPRIWVEPAIVVAAQITKWHLGQKHYLLYAEAARNCVLREDKGPYNATPFKQAYEQVLKQENSRRGRVGNETGQRALARFITDSSSSPAAL